MFTFHVACNMSDRVAAVGLVAAASISQSFDTCAPAEPVAYIAFHGTGDTVVPYEGGQIVPDFDDIGAYQSAHAAAEFWARFNGCPSESVRAQLPDTRASDNSIAYREAWAPCASGRAVELITLDGSGHTWPGHPPSGQRLGATNLDIDATQMLWDFFAANPKPPGG
jgi:polyhydroxybutyrate depolymerase